MSVSSAIRWPSYYRPEKCVHVSNNLDMSAPRDRVWAHLIRADLWPDWYPNSKNLRFLNQPGPDLQPGTRFTWKTFDLTITSTVLE